MVTENRADLLGIYKKFFLFCGIFLVLLLALEICAGMFMQETNIPDSAWSVTINGEPVRSAPGKSLSTPLKRGDVLTCTAVIPDCGFMYPALVFEPVRGSITVTSNGKTLYSSENDTETNELKSLINQISLTGADFTKPISITITAEQNNSFYAIPSIILEEQQNGFFSYIKARAVTFVVALFLFFLGVIGTVVCSASRFLSQKLMPLITISQFTFWASLCTFCHLGFIKVFITNETVCAILELISFYLAFAFICLIIYPKILYSKKHRKLFKILILAYIGYCLVSLALPAFTSLSVMDTFSIAIIIVIISLAYTVFHCIRQWIQKPERMSFPVTGFMALFVYALVEEVRILLHTAGVQVLNTPEMIILSSGILIFTSASLIDYFVWFKDSTIQETVEESWKRFTTPNAIPGISGYQKTLALLKELQDSKTQYFIITLSIDNIEELKLSPIPVPTLEDNFARLLYTVFSNYGITGNLGSGKFLVSLPDVPEGKMLQLLRVFKTLVNRDNANHPEAQVKFSYGYAHSTDSDEEEIVKICQLANNSRQAQEQKLIQ